MIWVNSFPARGVCAPGRKWECHLERYDDPMLEIDPELNRIALAEAAQKYPEVAGQAVGVVVKPLFQGFAWQLEWGGTAPTGQQAWEFQNTAIRAYKRLAGIPG